MGFNKQSFLNFIIENNVVGFFDQPVKLKSGRLSHWYANWRTVTEDAFLSEQLSDYIISFAESIGLKAETFFGVPEGATKMGILTQYRYAKQKKDFAKGRYALAMGRGKPKEHGEPKDRYFLGMPKGATVVIEDVTTTGGSLIETVERLKEAGVNVVAAIGLTNRMERRDDGKTVEDVMREKGVGYYAMSDATEILPLAAKKKNPPPDIKNKVVEYFRQYGTKEVIL